MKAEKAKRLLRFPSASAKDIPKLDAPHRIKSMTRTETLVGQVSVPTSSEVDTVLWFYRQIQ